MLKKLRKERNLSLMDLSALTGISASQISKFENNKRFCSQKNLYLLARALQVQPGDLLQPIDFNSDFSTPPFDHNDVPDVCPYEDGYEPSDCEKCKYKDRCPFKYTEEEDE